MMAPTIQAILLAIVVAMCAISPNPITIGVVVLVACNFLVTLVMAARR